MLHFKQYFQKKNIPNALTIFRIILMVIVIIFVLVPFGPICYSLRLNAAVSDAAASFQLNEILAAILFVIASLTDFLDGYIARKYHWVSDFGKIWDPLADKLLVDGVLICFAYLSLIPIWVCVLLILRDFIVDAFRMHALSKQIIVPASMWGKLKTVFELVGLILIFFFMHFSLQLAITTNQEVDWYLGQNLVMLIATVFSLVSMGIYIVQISKKINQAKIKQ